MAIVWNWTLSILILAAPLVTAAQVPPKPPAAAPVTKPVTLPVPKLSPAAPAKLAPKVAPAGAMLNKQALFEALRRSREHAATEARAAATRAQVEQRSAQSASNERKRIAMGYTYRHAQGRDCDDTDASVHRRASEVCDGRDNNCDGAVDEGHQLTFFLDADGDGHGNPAQRLSACPIDQQNAARDGRWLVLVGNDCDDADPSRWQGCAP